MKFQEINKEEYHNYLNKVLFKTFFHELGWQEILAKEFNFKFRFFNYQNKLILSLADLGNGKFFSHPFCEYGGPLPLTSGIDFQEFKNDLLVQFPKIKMRFHPKNLAYFSQILSQEGKFKSYWLTDIDKKSDEEIFNSFRKTLKHEIKKAENNNLAIKVCHNQEELKKFYRLYVRAIKNKGNLVLPSACFEYLFKDDNAEILLAYHNDRLIAGSVFLYYGNFVHYYLNASINKKLNANHLILWQKIKSRDKAMPCLYANKRHQVFDFGSDGQNPALAVFKSGWGTVEKDILEIGFDEKKEKKSLKRNLFKLLPDFLAIKISKKLAKKVL